MQKQTNFLVGFVVVAGVVLAGYLWWHPYGQSRLAPDVALTTPVVSVPPPAAASATRSTDSPPLAIQHPLEEVPIGPALPELGLSDNVLSQAFIGLFGSKVWQQFFVDTHIIRRIVATVDNLPREQAPVTMWPLRPAGSWLVTEVSNGVLILSPANAHRYAGYAKLVQTVNVKLLAGGYRHFYPLFQQAYVELGYPKGYFNDRLIVAIDNLLATPEPSAALPLVTRNVIYGFADADLQARSSGQKIMLRIGVDNERIVKAKLREFRYEVARHTPAG
ncbi:hypothetical protein GALL_424440 [mine drainage metagenome]|uniref:DUF3014 domain-containing protein n=1 Tax=mine drainage metagenome TaxID=410659 RepID=A0A1J5PWM4_9ZZZZ